jgi:hypothetical protein
MAASIEGAEVGQKPHQPAAGAVERAELEWRGLGCSYAVGGGIKAVMQDVWGKAAPGEMQVRAGGRVASALLG